MAARRWWAVGAAAAVVLLAATTVLVWVRSSPDAEEAACPLSVETMADVVGAPLTERRYAAGDDTAGLARADPLGFDDSVATCGYRRADTEGGQSVGPAATTHGVTLVSIDAPSDEGQRERFLAASIAESTCEPQPGWGPDGCLVTSGGPVGAVFEHGDRLFQLTVFQTFSGSTVSDPAASAQRSDLARRIVQAVVEQS